MDKAVAAYILMTWPVLVMRGAYMTVVTEEKEYTTVATVKTHPCLV